MLFILRHIRGALQLDFLFAGRQQTVEPGQAAWLGSIPDDVKQVMLAMQQMASVAVQSSQQRDPCHNELVQSLSPDALLACGESLSRIVCQATLQQR